MSRIGSLPISIPSGVEVKVDSGLVSATGPLGALAVDTHGRVGIEMSNGALVLSRPNDEKQSKAFHGLYQRLIGNMIHGVRQGYTKNLEIQGVGYRAKVEGKDLVCHLGYSHSVHYPAPEGITLVCPDQTHITVSGADKQAVGQVAAEIRQLRKPEPYKGKGIRYVGEYVRRKVGKTGVK